MYFSGSWSRYELYSPLRLYDVAHYFNMAGSELFMSMQNSSHIT